MPLPQPFPLPQHFSSAVEAGIRAEDVNIEPKYISSVANSMLCHKRYPTNDEYTHVATQIITKYPWMKARIGPQNVISNLNLSFTHTHMCTLM